ncbi:MAG: CHASE domain-containing protein [Proteobacteria bacterium]|nr:CHASE domain-containing protein [Pseudomonadota bacterium]
MEASPLQHLRTHLTDPVSRLSGRLWGLSQRTLGRVWSHAGDRVRRGARMVPFPVAKSLPRIQPVTGSILIFGAITAAGGYFAINDYATARLQRELDRASGNVSSILTKSIDRQIEIARSAGAMFSGPRANVDRWTFFKFAQNLSSKNPGLSAVEWIPRVPRQQRGKFERSANADGLFDFNFVQRSADGRNVKALDRSTYFPVYFVEPYTGNESELGLDLAADSNGATFLARVRDIGRMTTTHTGLGSSHNTQIAGFSVVMPVYRSSVAPFTVRERRQALSGYVRAKFRYDQLLEALRSGVGELPALDIYIFDRDDKNKLSLLNFFTSQPGDRAARPVNAALAYQGAFTAVEHEVAGQNWTIVVRPVRGVFQNVLGLTAWGFVAFTLLLTALLLRHLTTLRVAREEAEAANRAKSEFLAMMGHELRTPLNAVIGFSEMIINELFGPVSNTHYKEYTAHINHSATHLLGLINSILDLSKAEAGNYELDKKTVALHDIWNSVFHGLQAGIRDSGINFDDNLSDSPFLLNADPDVIRQILHNLVSNAITYTPQGGSVTVMAEIGADESLTLRVTDTGIGIAKENLELVLKPFRQVDNSLSRKYDGVGLGLPLTRMLVEIHGGKLQIASQLNEGTEITLIFPGDIIVVDDGSQDESENPAGPTAASDPPEEEEAPEMAQKLLTAQK